MVIGVYAFSALISCFKDPILSVRLSNIGFTDIAIALIYTVESVVYSVGAIICAYLAEKFNKLVTLFIYCMAMSIGLYALGGFYISG